MRCALSLSLFCLTTPALTAQSNPRWLTAPPATLTQDLKIDGVTEDFSVIGKVFVSASGRIAIQQPQDSRVLMYDADGKKLFSFGRKGSGPGEFEFLFPMGGWSGDDLWQFELRRRRITVITPTGTLARTFVVPTVQVPAIGKLPATSDGPSLHALYPDGLMLVRTVRERFPMDEQTRITPAEAVQFAMVAEDGMWRRAVVHIPYVANRGSLSVDRGWYGISAAFNSDPEESVAPDGSRIAFLTTQVGQNRNATITIIVVSPKGDTTLARTYPFVGRPLTKGELEQGISASFSRMEGRVAKDVLNRLKEISRKEAPPIHPYIRHLDLGLDNTIWLHPDTLMGGNQLLMLNERGDLELSVRMPPRTYFKMGSRDFIWAVSYDNDDIQSVVRYRINRQR